MEKLSQKENILLGHTLQRSFTNPSSSPRTPRRNSDIDFHDVFGGPPMRRSSVRETRYSFTESLDSFAVKGDDGTPASRSSPWSGLNEKPVFGGESYYGKRHSSDDFFSDIFKGDESVSSSPRKHDLDIFSSIPGSRVLSPAKPLPPSAEPCGSSSLPAQLSLPKRLSKGTDLPPFGSTPSSPYKHRDSTSNGSHTNSPRFPLSRFSSSEDLKSEETSSFRRSDNSSSRINVTKEPDNLEDPTSGSQIPFHFSIHRWASKGVPLMMPLRGGNGLRSKEKSTLRRSSSAKETGEKEKNGRQSPTSTIHDIDFPPLFHETEKTDIFRAEGEKGNDLLPDTGILDQRNTWESIEETISATLSENKSNRSSLEDVDYDTIKHQTSETLKPHSLLDVFSDEVEKKVTPVTKEAKKNELKTLSSLLSHSDDKQGERISGNDNMKKIKVKSEKKSSVTSHFSSSSKKRDQETARRNSKVEKASFLSSDMDSGHNIGRKKVGGKVSEFVKIFNKEPASNPQNVVDSENHGSRRQQKDTSKAERKATVDKMHMDEKPKLNNTDATIKVVNVENIDHLKQDDDHSAIKTASYISSSTSEQDSLASNTVHVPDSSKFTVLDVEEPFQENFSIKELPQDYDDLRETDNGLEEFKDIDAKIRQWSKGKEGNIRSLLSTLQYVLWPESGWKPVPLVDIIEGNAVKRSYQKALLYLHPDKLQQKGASSSQKYIAAQVFEILQEAWTHFNSLGAL